VNGKITRSSNILGLRKGVREKKQSKEEIGTLFSWGKRRKKKLKDDLFR